MAEISYDPFNDVTDPDAAVAAINTSLASLFPPTAINPFVTLDELASIKQMNTARLLGRFSAGVGAVEEITIGANLTLSVGGVLSASGGGGGITSLNGLVAAAQTFANDTNVTIVSAVSTHTLTWIGQLSIARGGTNSGTALVNDRLIISAAGAIVEHAVQTSGFVAFYGVTGLPTGDLALRWNNITKRLGVGTAAGSDKISITATAAERIIFGTGAVVAAYFTTTSPTDYTLGLENASTVVTPLDTIFLTKTGHVATVGSGQYIKWDNKVTTTGAVNVGQFGVIVTDITPSTYKTAFVWNTPNQTTGAMVERMRLSSNAVLKLVGPIITSLVPGIQTPNIVMSNTVVSTTTETIFTGTGISLTIPANTLQVGDRIKCTAFGVFSKTGAATLNIRLKNNAVSMLATGARAMVTGAAQGWRLESVFTVITTGVGGTVVANMMTLFQEGLFTDGTALPSSGTHPIDTTISQVISHSAQWSVSAAGNSIQLENVEWEIIKAL